MQKKLNVLAISYAKQTLKENSREQQRMLSYSKIIEKYTIIVFTRKKDNLPKFFQEGSLTIYGTNAYTKIGMLYVAYKIGKSIIQKDKLETWIVSSQDPFETSLVGQMLSRFKNVKHHIQVHGDPFSGKSWKQESIINRLRALYGRFSLMRADAVRVVSQRVKNSLVSIGVASKKISVLAIQSDLRRFLLVGESRRYPEKEICTFLYVGRIAYEKNINRLLEVFALAYDKNQSIRLRIVGEGPLLVNLQEFAKKLALGSVVTFVPWTKDVDKEMSQADAFVLASSHEGYGMVLAEAMATGLPSITTDVGCVGELLLHNKDGIVIPFDDDKLFASSLIDIAKSATLRKRLGTHAYQSVKKITYRNNEYYDQWKKTFHFL